MSAAMTRLVRIDCPLCGSKSFKLLFRRRDHRLQVTAELFDVVRCDGCSLVYVNPRPDDEAIKHYYTDEFYDAQASPEDALSSIKPRLDGMVSHVADLPAGRVLDVGCFKGEFLETMRRRGWDVHGVELHARPPNLFGLDIHYGAIEAAPFAAASFDLITIWAVLEHVLDPRGILHACRRLLKPGGRLVVLVPNFNSLPGRYMQHDDIPRHITMFTRKTLYRILDDCGFAATRFHCGQEVYSGTVRGLLNYLFKQVNGEPLSDIVAQARQPARWVEFCWQLHGRENAWMKRVDGWDQKLYTRFDRVLDGLGLGFIMTVHAVPK